MHADAPTLLTALIWTDPVYVLNLQNYWQFLFEIKILLYLFVTKTFMIGQFLNMLKLLVLIIKRKLIGARSSTVYVKWDWFVTPDNLRCWWKPHRLLMKKAGVLLLTQTEKAATSAAQESRKRICLWNINETVAFFLQQEQKFIFKSRRKMSVYASVCFLTVAPCKHWNQKG